jgi:hypothetical protein
MITIETTLPLGENKITWTFEDRCGNVTSKVQIINAINNDLPTVDALSSINIAIQPWDINGDGIADIEKGCIYARDLNVSSVSPCCDEPLVYSFSKNPLDTVRCYTCFDVGNVNIDSLYAHNCYGQYDYVKVTVNVQDNNNSNICELLCQLNRPIVTIPVVTPRCPNQAVTVTANVTYAAGATATNSRYLWSTGQTTQSISVNPATASTYTVTVSNQSGCNTTASRTVTVLPLPTIAIAGNNICQGASATLTASGASTYVWSTGATGSVITVSPPATQTYTVTGTDASGCSNTAQRVVTVSLPPAISINPAIAPTICPGVPTTLTAVFNTAGTIGTFVWSANAGSATTASVTVSPAMTMTYTVTASVNGCTATATKTVTVIPLPTPSAGPDVTICAGQSTPLTATGGGTYAWSTSPVQTTASISVSPAATTTYTVTVTNTTGCSATDQVVVNVNPVPVANAGADRILTCTNPTTILNGSSSIATSTYNWVASNGGNIVSGATTTTPTINAAGTYTLTVTAAGCSSTDVALVTANLTPPTVNAGADVTICQGTSTTLTATGNGTSYVWNTTPAQTTAAITVSPATTTTYAVTATNSENGCTATDQVSVIVTPLPTAAIVGTNLICIGSSTTLTASGGGNYVWNTTPAQTTAAITVTPTTTTTYVVTVTNNGCTATATRVVSVDPGTLTCQTQNITVYLNSAGSFTITPQMISTGAMGACTNITASVFPNVMACNDAVTNGGVVTVTLTVTNTSTTPPQSLSCTAQVTVRDTIKPNIICPPNQTIACNVFNPSANFGTATATDNCNNGTMVLLPPTVITNLNQCNIGTISRTFTAQDPSLNTRSCTQIITVTNTNPVTLANISFPPDITVTNCQGVTTAITGLTTVTPPVGSCSDLSISFTDDAPVANPLCRDTINRTWRVVDSCQLVTGTQSGIFTRVQRIIVVVPVPVISGPATITLYATPASGCQGIYNVPSPEHTSSGCNLVLSNTRNTLPSFNINGTYPVGTTNVTLTARETCYNQVATRVVQIIVLDTTFTGLMCRKTFPKIIDTNPPTARDTARSHAIINVSCASPGTVRISFSRTNIADSIRIYDCEDVLVDHTFTIYMFINGVVVDSCTTIATPVDPDNLCTGFARIAGNVNTENGEHVPNVSLELKGANMTNPVTDSNGKYSFPPMDRGGEYVLSPTRNDKPMDGVSTLDLIMIQRHILRLKNLDSPYKIIAADINKDDKLTANDLTELRKLILGINAKFTHNESWRMIDEKYEFPDRNDPFVSTLPEQYSIPNLEGSMLINWVGVKIGDVNGSYVSDANENKIEERTEGFGFKLENKSSINGQNTIVVRANSAAALSGFQLSLNLRDASNIAITSAGIMITGEHYSVNPDGTINISWSDQGMTAVSRDQALFEISFVTNEDLFTSELVSVNPSLAAEYYDLNLQPRTLAVSYFTNTTLAFEMLGNTPNPWLESTNIRFSVPKNGPATLKVRDITGRILLERKVDAVKGINNIKLSADDIATYGGVLIAEMTYDNQMKSMKMLQIR